MTLRVAVIGMGPIGNRHAGLYKDDPLAELSFIISEEALRQHLEACRGAATGSFSCLAE